MNTKNMKESNPSKKEPRKKFRKSLFVGDFKTGGGISILNKKEPESKECNCGVEYDEDRYPIEVNCEFHRKQKDDLLKEEYLKIKPESKDCGCGKFTGKDSYDCNKNGARTKPGSCNCLCHIEWKKGRRIDRKKWDKKTYLTFKDRRLAQFKEHFQNNKESYYKRNELLNIKYPVKKKARVALGNAVFTGKIKKLPCAFCGEIKVQGHHLDYENPLEVMWLCIKCHKLLHCLIRSEKKKSERDCEILINTILETKNAEIKESLDKRNKELIDKFDYLYNTGTHIFDLEEIKNVITK